ncbi:MAG: DUF58 domain-containing protein [Candidatus Heimdallarchaeota archaeon]|nr:DUF58 domain-containing protein [Candidatus Heimdallarchaeota archaeon]
MYTKKVTWTINIFFIVLLMGVGLRLLPDEVIVEWIVLVGLIPITLLIIANYISKPPDQLQLEVTRELEQTRLQEGEHLEVVLKVKNTGERAFDMLEILDQLPRQVSLHQGSNHLITSLDVGEETSLRYSIRCDYRGRWKIGPTRFRARNFLNSAFTTEVREETISGLVIIPTFETLNEIPFRTKYPKIAEGPFSSKFKGEGLEFAGVREYSSTDTPRRINWPATAKYGRLFSNEFELFRSADLLLILDATEKSSSVIDDQIKAVLSITEYFLKYKCRVGLIIMRDTVDKFALSSSREQLLRFTEKLIDVQATKVVNFKILRERMKKNLELYFPLNCLTVILSPLVSQQVNKILIEIAQRRTNSIFLSPSIVSAEWRQIEDKTDPALMLTHQDLLVDLRTELLKVVQRGLLILEWDVTIPFSVFMSKLKHINIRRGRR